MRNTLRLGWVLTAVSKTLAAVDHGLATFDRRTPGRRTDNRNHD